MVFAARIDQTHGQSVQVVGAGCFISSNVLVVAQFLGHRRLAEEEGPGWPRMEGVE
jgi:hypothetical protein